MCLQGLKNYRAAQAVFEMLASNQCAATERRLADDVETADDALAHYIERELRRRASEVGEAEVVKSDDDVEAPT